MRTGFCEISNVNFLSLFVESCKKWSIVFIIGCDHLDMRVVLRNLIVKVYEKGIWLCYVISCPCYLSFVACIDDSLHLTFWTVFSIWRNVVEGSPWRLTQRLPIERSEDRSTFGGRTIEYGCVFIWIEEDSGELFRITEGSDVSVVECICAYDERDEE